MPEKVINIVEIKNLKQLLVKNPNASIPLYNPDSGKVERILVADLVGSETVKVPWVIDQNYMIDEIAEFNNKIWKSLQDNNVGHQPYDDQTWWVEVSASSANGTALQPWAAGIFNIVNSSVTVNNVGYLLNNNVTLPFNSTDFDTELAANKWLPLGSSGTASTSANVALTTPLDSATNQDELNIYLFNNLGGGISENIYFDDTTPNFAYISYPFAFAVTANTIISGNASIFTSSDVAYVLGTTVAANDYLKVTTTVIGSQTSLTIARI